MSSALGTSGALRWRGRASRCGGSPRDASERPSSAHSSSVAQNVQNGGRARQSSQVRSKGVPSIKWHPFAVWGTVAVWGTAARRTPAPTITSRQPSRVYRASRCRLSKAPSRSTTRKGVARYPWRRSHLRFRDSASVKPMRRPSSRSLVTPRSVAKVSATAPSAAHWMRSSHGGATTAHHRRMHFVKRLAHSSASTFARA